MLNVKRAKELLDLEKNNPEKLQEIARELGLDKKYAKSRFTAIDVMIAENERDHPELIRNINEWIK